MGRLLGLFGAQLLMVTTCLGSDWWMDQPYGSSSEFNELTEYTHNTTLKCEDDRLDGIAYEFEYWVRPDLTIMYKGDDEYFQTLDGTAGWRVTDDGEMQIITVQEAHFGFYHCVVYSAPDTYVIKKGLNYKGAYFGDLWDIYRLNVIIGCSAAGGFLLACLIIYFIHCQFFDNDDDTNDKTEDNEHVTIMLANDDDYDVKDAHLRSSAGQSSGSVGRANNAYVINPEDEDMTKL